MKTNKPTEVASTVGPDLHRDKEERSAEAEAERSRMAEVALMVGAEAEVVRSAELPQQKVANGGTASKAQAAADAEVGCVAAVKAMEGAAQVRQFIGCSLSQRTYPVAVFDVYAFGRRAGFETP